MRWERLDKESAGAWEAAKTYFEMGAERSTRAVCRKLVKNRATIQQWCAKYHWVERARSWDQEQDDKKRRAEDQALKDQAKVWARRQQSVREEAYELGESLIATAKKHLSMPITKKVVSQDGTQVTIEPVNSSHYVAARLIELAHKLKSLSTGMNTEKIEHTGADGAPLPSGVGQIVIMKLPDNGRDGPEADEPAESKKEEPKA